MSRYAVWIVGMLLGANLLVGMVRPSTTALRDEADGAAGLSKPWLLERAMASDDRGARALEDISNEAGMSAYVKSTTAINLTNAKKAFTKGVEAPTTDYIIGLVPIKDYDASWDVHVLVHRTGWILAYYPKEWVTAKALNEKHQNVGGSTKLSLAIEAVGAKIGQSFSAKYSYYNFAQPSATKMLVIYFKDGQDPRIKLPSSFTYYEKSVMVLANYNCKFYISGSCVHALYSGNTYFDISSLLTEGSYVQTWSDGGWGMIVILYS
jgi:hypothetical protein